MIFREMESPNPIPEGFRREKWIKYVVSVFGIYSGSGVLDRKRDDRIPVLGRYQPKGLYGCGPAAIASIAFLTKFKITCCSWVRSAIICGRSS